MNNRLVREVACDSLKELEIIYPGLFELQIANLTNKNPQGSRFQKDHKQSHYVNELIKWGYSPNKR